MESKLYRPWDYMLFLDPQNRPSSFQKRVKDLLYKHWLADVVFEEFPVMGSRMTIDFYNANKKIAIEVDGGQHYKYNKFFHANDRQKFLEQLKRDETKDNFCEMNKIELIRIIESDKLDDNLLKTLKII